MEGYEKVLIEMECSAAFIEELHIRVNGLVDPSIPNQEIWDLWLNDTLSFYIGEYGSESAAMPHLRDDVMDIMGEYMSNTECYNGKEIREYIGDCSRKAIGLTNVD